MHAKGKRCWYSVSPIMPSLSQQILHHWIRERIARVSWYHSFEVWPGILTPGALVLNARQFLDAAGVPPDLSGIRALDIGTWDGPIAFELERRGATVIAVDVQDPNETGFNATREIRRSRVHYVRASVYELTQVLSGSFDLICYLGVFYHLKDPIKAFEEICAVLAADGQVVFEGECLRNYAETLEGKAVGGKFVSRLANSDVPLSLCAPGQFKERPNWFIPNLACLRSWAAAGGLKIVKHVFIEDAQRRPFPNQRVWGIALKAPLAPAVDKVTREGSTIFVMGSGFTPNTAINFFFTREEKDVNLGGLDPRGNSIIPVTFHSPALLSFTVPEGVQAGRCYVQAVNPPFTENHHSGSGQGGSFVLDGV
jgi:2-polyprenyl-3-methyl-5-hydroxy-6-metoxy-1,4-benzoquinol methylase